MAAACTTCGGVGRGSIDEEFGWRMGTKSGQPDVCPTCQGRLDDRFEAGEWDTMNPKTGKLTKATEKPDIGPYKDPQARRSTARTVAVVDGGTSYSNEEFDPGMVNTGRESVTIDEATAMAGAEQG